LKLDQRTTRTQEEKTFFDPNNAQKNRNKKASKNRKRQKSSNRRFIFVLVFGPIIDWSIIVPKKEVWIGQ
jgi:hypothetical protein